MKRDVLFRHRDARGRHPGAETTARSGRRPSHPHDEAKGAFHDRDSRRDKTDARPVSSHEEHAHPSRGSAASTGRAGVDSSGLPLPSEAAGAARARAPWQRVLYLEQDYEDNYVDASFLQSLVANGASPPSALPCS